MNSSARGVFYIKINKVIASHCFFLQKDIFGMRNRSRRGSMDCILEDTPQSPQPISGKPSRRASNTAAGGGARRRSSDGRKASGSARGAGSSRRGSSANEPASAPLVGSGAFVSTSADTFSYWLQVQVYPPVSLGFTRNLSPHSAVNEKC